MLTVGDVKKLIEVFATKQDIKDLATSDELSKFRNEILGGMDKVYGEVKAIREEQASHNQQHEDTDNKLRVQDERIQKLEKAVTSA